MAPNISGKWLMDTTKSESPEDILRLQGMGWAKRKIAGSIQPTLELTQESDKLRLVLISSLKNEDQTVEVGGDWKKIKIDDIDTDAKAYIDGEALVSEHKFDNGDGHKAHRTIRRWLESDGKVLIQETHIKLDNGEEAKCKRVFNKV